MHRFFLPPQSIQSGSVTFPPDLSHQIASVLRLQPGEIVTVLDGLGNQYEVELTRVERGQAGGRVLSQRPAGGEAPIHLALYLALSRREKFEWMLQKCTEVGASSFVPVLTSRTLVQDERDTAKKLERWQRILREAAEQSHRGRVPELREPLRFEAALRAAAPHDLKLIPWEGEQSVTLRQAIRSFSPPLREGGGRSGRWGQVRVGSGRGPPPSLSAPKAASRKKKSSSPANPASSPSPSARASCAWKPPRWWRQPC